MLYAKLPLETDVSTNFSFFFQNLGRWAEALVVAAKYENNMTAKERKLHAQLKKLA